MNCLQVQWSFSPKVKVTATLGAWVEVGNVSSARLSKLTSGKFLSNDNDKGGEKGWPHAPPGSASITLFEHWFGFFYVPQEQISESVVRRDLRFSSLSEKTSKSNHL